MCKYPIIELKDRNDIEKNSLYHNSVEYDSDMKRRTAYPHIIINHIQATKETGDSPSLFSTATCVGHFICIVCKMITNWIKLGSTWEVKFDTIWCYTIGHK